MHLLDILRVFLRLGLTSFGGPAAHIGYFHREFVQQRQWVNDQQFNGWLAICQALPGPASSQLGFLIGWHRKGLAGALMAWLGFTLPSALILTAIAAYGLTTSNPWAEPIIHGLKIVAIAVVAQAVLSMFSSLCRHWQTRVLAALGFGLALSIAGWHGQFLSMALGALAGMTLLRHLSSAKAALAPTISHCPSPSQGLVLLLVFLALLLGLPWVANTQPALNLFDTFYRGGALVFGGGHVVLPLLESATVGAGTVQESDFLAGYGLAQAMPGPLFTFSAWLGIFDSQVGGWLGAGIALVAIFLPGLLLIIGVLPWWQWLSKEETAMAALLGVNASVVGILAAAWVNPILLTSVRSAADFIIAALMTVLLIWRKSPVWLVVILAPALTLALHLLRDLT